MDAAAVAALVAAEANTQASVECHAFSTFRSLSSLFEMLCPRYSTRYTLPMVYSRPSEFAVSTGPIAALLYYSTGSTVDPSGNDTHWRFRNIHFWHNFSSVFTIFSITVSFRSTIRDINFTNFS